MAIMATFLYHIWRLSRQNATKLTWNGIGVLVRVLGNQGVLDVPPAHSMGTQ